jgi:hypothetical protein
MAEKVNLPSVRVLALAAILSWVPVAVGFAMTPKPWWINYPGIVFHLSLFFLVPRLPAPSWARAAGYGWLIIDTTVGVLSLNGVPDAIAQPMRLGGHIFAGIWIAVSSLSGSTPMMVTGLISGIWLFVFTFVSPFYPMSALGPASLVVLVWLGLPAWQNGSTRGRLATSG